MKDEHPEGPHQHSVVAEPRSIAWAVVNLAGMQEHAVLARSLEPGTYRFALTVHVADEQLYVQALELAPTSYVRWWLRAWRAIKGRAIW